MVPALAEAVRYKHLNVFALLLQTGVVLKDEETKTIYQLAAVHGKAMFDGVLKLLHQEFYDLVRVMRGMACFCRGLSNGVREAVERRCMSCCAARVHEVSNALCSVIFSVQSVRNRHLAPVAFMAALQKELGVGLNTTELMFAVSNNLCEAAVAFVGEQRNLTNINDNRASDFAASIPNPELWALFPEEIGVQYAADLLESHGAECNCGGFVAKTLRGAVKNDCLRCAAQLIWQAEGAGPQQTELMEAATKSDGRFARLLRHRQAGVQGCGYNITALMIAAQANNVPVVAFLAETEAGLQDQEGTTGLIIAAKKGFSEIVHQLKPREAGLKDAYGRTALMLALQHGQLGTARALLPLEQNIVDNVGHGPVEYAYLSNNIDIWRLFDPDVTEEGGRQRHQTCIQQCVCEEPVEDLINAAENGCFCCCLKHKDQAGQLIDDSSALMVAAINGNFDIARLLIDKEARMQNWWKRTALVEAAESGHIEIVKMLLPLEKDIKDHMNSSICVYAARSRDEPTLEYVLNEIDPGAYLYLREARKSECTCGAKSYNLRSAAKNGCLKCASNAIHEVGKREQGVAMVYAAERGHAAVVKLLIPFEAGVSGDRGITALMTAARSGQAETVKLLLPHEAGMVSQLGMTALTEAATRLRRECFELLRADPLELGSSKIPAFLLSAYDGDLAAALRHSGECPGALSSGLNVLHFAFLRGGAAVLQALMAKAEVRAPLVKLAPGAAIAQESLLLGLFFDAGTFHLFKKVAPLVCSFERRLQGEFFSAALSHCCVEGLLFLRVFSTPAETVVQNAALGENSARFSRAVKNIGALHFESADLFDQVYGNLTENPLAWKEWALAEKQRARRPGRVDGQNFARRETEAEAKFNRALLLEARESWWNTRRTMTQAPTGRSAGQTAAKLAHNKAVILDAFRYLQRKVQEMLEE